MPLANLLSNYEKRKKEIRKRLEEFSRTGKKDDNRIFAELAFCLCVPQTKAVASWKAVSRLMENGLLYSGSQKEILNHLSEIRFNENKSGFIIEAREMFSSSGEIKIKNKINIKDLYQTRDWLVENVRGMGYKAASHFLRNIGHGKKFAILDIHVLNNLKKYGVIDSEKPPSTRKKYLEIEEKTKEFAKRINIPLEELDLLFWSEQTGYIFK